MDNDDGDAESSITGDTLSVSHDFRVLVNLNSRVLRDEARVLVDQNLRVLRDGARLVMRTDFPVFHENPFLSEQSTAFSVKETLPTIHRPLCNIDMFFNQHLDKFTTFLNMEMKFISKNVHDYRLTHLERAVKNLINIITQIKHARVYPRMLLGKPVRDPRVPPLTPPHEIVEVESTETETARAVPVAVVNPTCFYTFSSVPMGVYKRNESYNLQ